jgi:hypothetical protein
VNQTPQARLLGTIAPFAMAAAGHYIPAAASLFAISSVGISALA